MVDIIEFDSVKPRVISILSQKHYIFFLLQTESGQPQVRLSFFPISFIIFET